MRLFIYEWVTGGGLVGQEGALPESLLREGLSMAQAAAADAAGLDDCTPVLLRDLRVPALAAAGGEVIEVDSRAAHDERFTELAETADAVLLIAPETDGVLLAAAERATAAGARLVSPASKFIGVASDKEQTGERLAAAGVPVPESCRVDPGQPLPDGFAYPAVIKPIDGAGSQDTHVVAHAGDRPPAYAWPRRLERFAPGTPASVAVVGVAGGEPIALPPCRQRLSTDGRLSYLGGSSPLAPGLADRAKSLALRAIDAMPPLVGYAGIDLVLGDAPDGSLDTVIEINPRLTTSFAGLRRVVEGGLMGMILAAARGERGVFRHDERPLAFDADGAVYWEALGAGR